MKKTPIILLAMAVAGIAVAQSVLQFRQWVAVGAATGTPTQLTNATLVANSITLIAMKTFQTSNTTAVFVGFGTNANGEQGIALNPGASCVIKDAKGVRTVQCSNVWFDVTTAGDGVIVLTD